MHASTLAASLWRFVAELPGGLLTDGWIAKVRMALGAFSRAAMRVEKRDHIVLSATLGLDPCRVREGKEIFFFLPQLYYLIPTFLPVFTSLSFEANESALQREFQGAIK